ncbi:Uncharacterised protein [Vibrio cholerae]|nr:Uncharacterised protein [Vibrio cholerae]
MVRNFLVPKISATIHPKIKSLPTLIPPMLSSAFYNVCLPSRFQTMQSARKQSH